MDHSTLFKMTHLHTLVNCIVKLTKLGEGDGPKERIIYSTATTVNPNGFKPIKTADPAG